VVARASVARVVVAVVAVLAISAGATIRAAGATTHASAAPAPATVTLQWVGDIALSTQRGLPPGGLARALGPVAHQLQNADLTTGNLEGTLSVGGASKCGSIGSANCFAFQAPASTAGQLHALGFDLVNQANNHSLDYGASGRAQTVSALDHAGVAHTGFPGQITVLRANGIKVAFLGFAPYSFDGNLLDVAAAKALVREARRRAHLGENRGDARGFAHAVINAGASIVLGSGPHVIRGIERYRNRLIAYSLGNFVGYHTLGAGGVLSESAILRVTLDARGRVVAGDWLPVTLVDGLPRPDPSGASARLVGRLSGADFPQRYRILQSGIFALPSDAKP
jgi:poly-gamma-glutamate capsule biosynthesis protein CapA/YwtB (metallophosphatase superfamily)